MLGLRKSRFGDADHTLASSLHRFLSESVMKAIFVVMVLAFALTTGMAVTTILSQRVS